MLKVRYQTSNNKVTGWCADPMEYDGLQARNGEAVVELDIAIPAFSMAAAYVDLDTETIVKDLNYVPPGQKQEDAIIEVNSADFDALQKAAETAKDMAALQTVVSDLILIVGRLAEADGLTPVTPAAEVGP